MARLEDFKQSITKMQPEEFNIWLTDLRQSRRTPKIIHSKDKKKSTKKKRGTGPKKQKKITTRTSSKVMIKTLTKEQREQLAKELKSL